MNIKHLNFEENYRFTKELKLNVNIWYKNNIAIVLENNSVSIFSLDRN